MNLSRRSFLFRAAPAAVGGALALEELLRPSPTIFLPPRGGWGGRSLEQLWLDYANQVRPLGVCVGCMVDHSLKPSEEWLLREQGPGRIVLALGDHLSRATERTMRSALTQTGLPDWLNCQGTFADLLPWVERPPPVFNMLAQFPIDWRNVPPPQS